MGNRFSTIKQYHTLILGHAILGAIVFLLIVPSGIITARFYRGTAGVAIRYHVYCQILAVMLLTVVFMLGYFAVGPQRSLTNPHHGIGVAIYVLFLVQAIGGLFVRHIRKISIRVMLHQWIGRATALLGIVQIPLGLTLYGSPEFTFILYAVWMAFLLVAYFILSYRHQKYRDQLLDAGGRSEYTRRRYDESERREKSGGGWLGPLAAGAGILALLKRKKNKDERERSRSRARSQSRSRVPEVLPSRRGSASYFDEEEYSEKRSEKRKSGGFMTGLLGALGAGALAKKMLDRRSRRLNDEEYSAVATDTPSRRNRRRRDSMSGYTETEVTNRPRRNSRSGFTESDSVTDGMTDVTRHDRRSGRRDDRRSSLLPGPGDPVAAAAAMSAAESRPKRPVTPRPAQPRPANSRYDSHVDSDYSSYISSSRKAKEEQPSPGAGKGLLAGLGLGWLAKRMQGRKEDKPEEERLRYDEERRDGLHGSKYTADGYGSPVKRPSRRRRSRPPPPRSATITTVTGDSELSSIEPRPAGASSMGPPMPPLVPAGTAPSVGPGHSRTRTESSSRIPVTAPTNMPPIPPDGHGHGILHRDESGSENYQSGGGRSSNRRSSRSRRRAGEAAAAAAAASGVSTAEEEDRRRSHSRSQSQGQSQGRPTSQPVSVKVKYDDVGDRVTLRRLTEEESARQGSRHRSSSISSASAEGTIRQGYRRDSSGRRTAEEEAAEHLASEPLSPPQPAFAGGRRPAKDSAYYSGPASGYVGAAGGYSGPPPAAGAPPRTPTMQHGNPTVSSIGTQETHGTWSQVSPSGVSRSGTGTGGRPSESITTSAADRRRRRRLERRESSRANTVDFD
jgi:hypothetical protein